MVKLALARLPKSFREVPKMCFDGLARVSRVTAQLAFFVADVLDVYEGKAIWNVFIDSLFLNALPVLMLATVFFLVQLARRFPLFGRREGLPRCTPTWT